ncbi:MAG TPA: ChaN family lipoprotein [Rubricoccaceae bacterium]|jgi:uncharacterized iron-regulated protein
MTTRPLLTAAVLAAVILAGTAAAQPADTLMARYQAFDASGATRPLGEILDAAVQADVVFVGEIHDDPTGHAVELAVLSGLHERAGTRPVVLALEMFEADVQTVSDEYLAGTISERDFLEAARPWANYAADYRPLVEYAKANRMRVVAANAPVRYVRAVGRGVDLAGLSPAALAVLPPLPVAEASEGMAAAFSEAMGGHGGTGMGGMLGAQNLRDASMAYRTAEALRGGAAGGRPLVVHVNGGFHTAGGRGIPEHLARFAPTARVFRIDLAPVADVDAPPLAVDADAVVQTPARLVPSRSGE